MILYSFITEENSYLDSSVYYISEMKRTNRNMPIRHIGGRG